jgi:hypothetical protein
MRFAVACLLALLTSGCMTPQKPPTSTISRVEPGDNDLTCSQIKDQVAVMDATLARANGDTQASADKLNDRTGTGMTAGGTAASMASGVPFLSFAGLGASMMANKDKGKAATDQMQAQTDAADAKARKENLVALGNGKHCY